MFKRIAVFLCATLAIVLSSCSASPTSGLKNYTDDYDGYEFLYPNGWTEIDATNIAPDVIFHDLIESSENVSVVINPAAEGVASISELGTPSEVGNTLGKTAIAPPDSGREAELVGVASRTDSKDHTYYLFEYAVTLPQGERHNLASAAISRGQLFTLNVSTPERRWEKDGDQLRVVAQSFKVY
ncbi:MAG: photosystem II reaction center PsbP [Geitlerinemataceae cyanobacterium]